MIQLLRLSVVLCLFLSACERRKPAASYTPRPGWTLTWSDEFSGPDGSAPDPTKWKIETGGNGWGNHELEYYTSRSQNLHVRKWQTGNGRV